MTDVENLDYLTAHRLKWAKIYREKYHMERHAGNGKAAEMAKREFEALNAVLPDELKLSLEVESGNA